MRLHEALNMIKGWDKTAMEKAQSRLDSLTKPLGSLGKLEDIIKQLAGISRDMYPSIDNKKIIIMCSDNGVVEEGVSSCPKEVTASVARNFLKGFTGINVLSGFSGADIVVVDIGIDDDINENGILDRKIRKGTWNIAMGPAMTRNEAIKAIEVGIDVVESLKEQGVSILGTGEMGIGNTTTSCAVSSVLTKNHVDVMVGKGSGLSAVALRNKTNVIKRAILVNKPDPDDPIDVLAKLGGFDIAGLTGCFIGAAALRIPILIDGFISAAAALVAVQINPGVKKFIIPSHGSAEPGNEKIMKTLGMEPMLNLGMCLGEGTGAAIAFKVIDAAMAAYKNMGTFTDADIEQYKPQE